MVTKDVLFFPHSPNEFRNASELADWLQNFLSKKGEYLIATITPGYRRVSPRSLVLFHKDKRIVGEAIAKDACRPYEGTKESPVTGAPYEGIIYFNRTSVRCYAKLISLEDASKMVGAKLIPRGVRRLELSQCETLLSELRKCSVCGKDPCINDFWSEPLRLDTLG